MIKVEEDFQTNLGGGEFFWNFEDLAATQMESFQDLCRQLIHFSWQILLGKTQDRLFCCVDKKDISSSGTTMMHIYHV